MPARLKLTAVVLRTVDYGESDRVASFLSLERGRVSAFARGARASKRRFGGALEPFTLLSAEVRERPGADLFTLDNVTVQRSVGGIRGDLARIACAAYACELARELLRESEPHPDLFALLVDLLSRFDAGPASAGALRAFELGALRSAGLMPRLDACARCDRPAPTARGGASVPARVTFDPSQGGLLCSQCAPEAAPGSLEVAFETIWALRRLQSGGLEAVLAAPLPRPVGAEARRVLEIFIEHQLGRRLGSRKFLEEVAPEIE